jgi:hypothetical protein
MSVVEHATIDPPVIKSRGGRPRAEVRSTALMTWVPTTYHDRLIQMANERHMSVSGLVRQILILRLSKTGDLIE